MRSLLASKPIFTKLPKPEGVSAKGHEWTLSLTWLSTYSKEDLFHPTGKASMKPKKEKDPAASPQGDFARDLSLQHALQNLFATPTSSAVTQTTEGGNLSLLSETLDATATTTAISSSSASTTGAPETLLTVQGKRGGERGTLASPPEPTAVPAGGDEDDGSGDLLEGEGEEEKGLEDGEF